MKTAEAVEAAVTPEVKKSKFSARAVFSQLSVTEISGLSTHKQLLVDRNNFQKQKHIVVTECPREPCAVLYEDIFDSIIVECRSNKHNLNKNGSTVTSRTARARTTQGKPTDITTTTQRKTGAHQSGVLNIS